MNLFELGIDDPLFPTTNKGLREAGLIVEDAINSDEQVYTDNASIVYDAEIRSAAISALLDWNEAGDFTYDAMDICIFNSTGMDEEETFSPDDEETYNDVWQEVYNALCSYGVDEKDAEVFCNGPSAAADNAAKRIAERLGDILGDVADENEDLYANYIYEDALGGSVFKSVCKHMQNKVGMSEDAILEAATKKIRAIRNGKKVVLKKAVNKPKGMKMVDGKLERETIAEKNHYKKMRRKAFTATAKRHRAKSFRKGQQLGLHN
mgnify:CR=1 FL=1